MTEILERKDAPIVQLTDKITFLILDDLAPDGLVRTSPLNDVSLFNYSCGFAP